MTVIDTENLNVNLENKQILFDINFSVNKGTLFGLIGPNGSGKSTLIKSVAGLLPRNEGEIEINKQSLEKYSQKDLAKQISYVPQETLISFDFSAWDVVSMGRYVYGSVFKSESKDDIDKIEWAMKRTGTLHLADQSILSLSGGQRQLIIIAKALAQDTPIILLDEPISALDIFYQLHILSLLTELCKTGKTIIIVLHDLNLAARFCDELLILNEGSVKKIGSPEQVMTESLLKEIYHINVSINKDSLTNCTTITPFL